MKKLLYLFTASLLVFTSCSKDDETADVPAETLLPRKIVETTVDDGKSGSLTYTITYDGNKLKDIALTDASRYVYTYTGDVITKVEFFTSGDLHFTDDYAYENGKLISKITSRASNANVKQKITFVYNSNGTVNANKSEIINGQEIKYDTTTLYTFLNGNIASTEYIDAEKDKISSTYDDKKSPYYNVTGVKLLLDLDDNFNPSVNNEVKIYTVRYNSSGVVDETFTEDFTNKYNAAGFLSETFTGDSQNSYKLAITY